MPSPQPTDDPGRIAAALVVAVIDGDRNAAELLLAECDPQTCARVAISLAVMLIAVADAPPERIRAKVTEILQQHPPRLRRPGAHRVIIPQVTQTHAYATTLALQSSTDRPSTILQSFHRSADRRMPEHDHGRPHSQSLHPVDARGLFGTPGQREPGFDHPGCQNWAMSTRTRPPADLGTPGKAFWRSVLAVYTLSPVELVMLGQACRVVDLLARADADLAAADLTVTGQPKAHPLIHPAWNSRTPEDASQESG